MSGFLYALDEHFPGAMPEEAYVRATLEAAGRLGFDGPNTIACVGVCRDELTQPFMAAIHEIWGEAFNLASLAGLPLLGKTGFLAAMAHSPQIGGRDRHAFFCLAHIAIGANGEIGVCARPGQRGPSKACGALVGFHGELQGGRLRLELDRDDLEQSLIKQRLMREMRYGDVPDLVSLTQLAHRVILADLERMIALTVEPQECDYAVFTGIQVHGPDENYVWPGAAYAVTSEKRTELHLA